MPASHSARAGRIMVTALGAVALVLSCASCAPRDRQHVAEYCAIMPDTVGLYVDNPVTKMGYPVGKVTSITPGKLDVRVDFTVNEGGPLPAAVKAVIRSASILADRSLELVGNDDSGPELTANGCIPLTQSFTPKSLSEVVGSSTEFINSINPQGSTNVGALVSGLDQSLKGQGGDVNKLLTTTSAVLDSPDQAIGDIGSIIDNFAQLTSTLAELEPTLKSTLEEADQIGPDAVKTTYGGVKTFEGIIPIITAAADIETELGPDIQQTLDEVGVVLRKATPRAPFYASLLNVTPRVINGLANVVNNKQFSIRYRPPLYRIRTPDGALQCGIMNASMPGSCANVGGTPYAVDVALLQYALTQAAANR